MHIQSQIYGNLLYGRRCKTELCCGYYDSSPFDALEYFPQLLKTISVLEGTGLSPADGGRTYNSRAPSFPTPEQDTSAIDTEGTLRVFYPPRKATSAARDAQDSGEQCGNYRSRHSYCYGCFERNKKRTTNPTSIAWGLYSSQNLPPTPTPPTPTPLPPTCQPNTPEQSPRTSFDNKLQVMLKGKDNYHVYMPALLDGGSDVNLLCSGLISKLGLEIVPCDGFTLRPLGDTAGITPLGQVEVEWHLINRRGRVRTEETYKTTFVVTDLPEPECLLGAPTIKKHHLLRLGPNVLYIKARGNGLESNSGR